MGKRPKLANQNGSEAVRSGQFGHSVGVRRGDNHNQARDHRVGCGDAKRSRTASPRRWDPGERLEGQHLSTVQPGRFGPGTDPRELGRSVTRWPQQHRQRRPATAAHPTLTRELVGRPARPGGLDLAVTTAVPATETLAGCTLRTRSPTSRRGDSLALLSRRMPTVGRDRNRQHSTPVSVEHRGLDNCEISPHLLFALFDAQQRLRVTPRVEPWAEPEPPSAGHLLPHKKNVRHSGPCATNWMPRQAFDRSHHLGSRARKNHAIFDSPGPDDPHLHSPSAAAAATAPELGTAGNSAASGRLSLHRAMKRSASPSAARAISWVDDSATLDDQREETAALVAATESGSSLTDGRDMRQSISSVTQPSTGSIVVLTVSSGSELDSNSSPPATIASELKFDADLEQSDLSPQQLRVDSTIEPDAVHLTAQTDAGRGTSAACAAPESRDGFASDAQALIPSTLEPHAATVPRKSLQATKREHRITSPSYPKLKGYSCSPALSYSRGGALAVASLKLPMIYRK